MSLPQNAGSLSSGSTGLSQPAQASNESPKILSADPQQSSAGVTAVQSADSLSQQTAGSGETVVRLRVFVRRDDDIVCCSGWVPSEGNAEDPSRTPQSAPLGASTQNILTMSAVE